MARSDVMAAIAAELLTVTGIKAVYAAGATTGVKEIPEVIDTLLPAAVFMPGDAPVIPGNWERQTWNITGTIWTRSAPRGERYRELLDLAEPILGTYRTVSAAVKASDTDIQQLILKEFGAISGEQWQRGDGAPWYLVLPFTVEVKVNRSTNYSIA